MVLFTSPQKVENEYLQINLEFHPNEYIGIKKTVLKLNKEIFGKTRGNDKKIHKKLQFMQNYQTNTYQSISDTPSTSLRTKKLFRPFLMTLHTLQF